MAPAGAVVLAAEGGESGAEIIIPLLNELIWGFLAFAVFFFLMRRYAWPRLSETLAERTAGIEGKLEQAERDRAEAQRLLEEYRQQLDEARGEAARIRTEAQAQRQRTIDAARAEASTQAAEVLRRGEEQLAAERQQVVTSLRGEIGQMALTLAERVVGESLEDEARQRRTVDRFLEELEAQADAAERDGRPDGDGADGGGPDDGGRGAGPDAQASGGPSPAASSVRHG